MMAGKKTIGLAIIVAMVCLSTQNLKAQEYYCSNLGGYGYEESRDCPSMIPAIVLGTIFLGVIIAVALQGDSGHCHSHD